MGFCRECRFYDGINCNIDGGRHSATYSCNKFSNYQKSIRKICVDCRFYDGRRCIVDNSSRSTTSSCIKFSPFKL